MALVRVLFVLLLLGAFLLRNEAEADVIIQVQSIVSNTAGDQPGLEEAFLIDQSGLVDGTNQPASYVSGVTDFSSFVPNTSHSGPGWNSAAFENTGTMVFDLGANFNLSGMALWNHSNFFNQAIDSFSLRVDADGDFTSGASFVGSFSADHTIEPNAQVFAFTPISGRFVEWAFLNAGNGFGTRADEVAFAAVPSPSTWTSVLGLMLVALGFRRHRLFSLGSRL